MSAKNKVNRHAIQIDGKNWTSDEGIVEMCNVTLAYDAFNNMYVSSFRFYPIHGIAIIVFAPYTFTVHSNVVLSADIKSSARFVL